MYEDMDAAELRATLEAAERRALGYAQELVEAFEASNWVQMAGMAVALKPALAQIRRLRKAMQMGVAA